MRKLRRSFGVLASRQSMAILPFTGTSATASPATPTILFAVGLACVIGFFYHGSLRAFPQAYSTAGYPPTNVEPPPYHYGELGDNGQSSTTLRDPLIPGAQSTAPGQAPMPGQAPPIGSGSTPLPVNPGMGGGPLLLPSNAFPQVSNVDALPATSTPPSKVNDTTLYPYTGGNLGPSLYIPPASALDTTTVNGAVSPYLQTPPTTPGMPPPGVSGDNSGLIYAKQYTNQTYNAGLYYPPASIGGVGANGGIVGTPSPTTKWNAQTSHDYGLRGASRIPAINGKQPAEYYNTDFGQNLELLLKSQNPTAAAAPPWQNQDGPRPTTYLNWNGADSSTEQAAANTPSDYNSTYVYTQPNSHSPATGSTATTTWNLFGHRQNFVYNQNGYNVPHSPNTTGTPVYAQQTTAYY